MNKYIGVLIGLLFLLFGCSKEFLNRLPESSISPQQFFNSEQDLILYTNSFYTFLPGAATFSNDHQSDNVEGSSIGQLMGGRLTVPGSGGGWDWETLRNVNYFLENYSKANAPLDVKEEYAGLARFFRAWFYFEKMKRFGDLPWLSTSLNVDSPELFKARDSRVLITDSILADLDYAISTLGVKKNNSRVNKWTALALKSRVSLFEGTFRKYHSDLGLVESSGKLLELSYKSAEELMDSQNYKLYSTGNPESDYNDLFVQENGNPDEFILAEAFSGTLNKTHYANGAYTVSTVAGGPGLTKDFINSYLMKDGTSFTNIDGYDKMKFVEEVKDRDPRLYQTIRTPGYQRAGTTKVLTPDFSHSLTGYQNIKYVTSPTQDGYNTNTNDLPVFRYAEVLLNFAEAKAELELLTQLDLDKSINLLRKRVDMPPLLMSNIIQDDFQRGLYKNLNSDIISEIRRERRIELVFEGFRYYDVIRWKEGQLFVKTFYGMYFPNLGGYDLDGDGNIDIMIVNSLPVSPVAGVQYYLVGGDRVLSNVDSGNLIVHPTIKKVFDQSKNYLFPLPTSELILNKNLVQNPNW